MHRQEVGELHSLEYDGRLASTFGISVNCLNPFTIPERAVDLYDVPGRNGAVLIDQGVYRNITRTYELYIRRASGGSAAAAETIRQYLTNDGRYHRLVDDYDEEHFMLARVAAPVTIEALGPALRGVRCTVDFDVKPQRYLWSGTEWVTLSASASAMTNPVGFDAYPLIRIPAGGATRISVGGITMQITDNSEMIVYDAETMDAILLGGGSANDRIMYPQRFVLGYGTTTVTADGAAEIQARWWEP